VDCGASSLSFYVVIVIPAVRRLSAAVSAAVWTRLSVFWCSVLRSYRFLVDLLLKDVSVANEVCAYFFIGVRKGMEMKVQGFYVQFQD